MKKLSTEIWQQEIACTTIIITKINDNNYLIFIQYRIDINMIIKVADFGLSVNMGAKEYYRLTNHMDTKLPVKWMAPESLADYVFSEMSDVVKCNSH